MKTYIPLGQEDKHAESSTSAPLLDEAEHPFSDDLLSSSRACFDIGRLPLAACLALTLTLLLAMSIGCLAITTREVNIVLAGLKGRMDFTETRDLPRQS